MNPVKFLRDVGSCVGDTIIGTCDLIGKSCSSLWQASCCGEPDLDEGMMDEVIRRIDAYKLYVKGLEEENSMLKQQIDYMGKMHHENQSPEENRESNEREGN